MIWTKYDSDGEWPKVKPLLRELFGTEHEFDGIELARSLPGSLGRVDASADQILLRPRALAVVPEAEPLLGNLVALVDIALERYEDTARDPVIDSREFDGLLGIDAHRTRQLAEILELDSWLLRPAGGTVAGEDIRFAVDDVAIRYVREVYSIDDYFDAQDRMWYPAPQPDAIQEQITTEAESVAEPRVLPEAQSIAGSPTSVVDPGAAIFLVHGHAHERLNEVARFIEKISEHKVVILHEQADRGQTLIEKFESNAARAAHAVVLLTADDIGRAISGADTEDCPRGRQNVVLELGFFYGKLGRSHVTVLKDPRVEEPSDIHGIVYIPFDPNGVWKAKLGRELHASGISVDMNKAP